MVMDRKIFWRILMLLCVILLQKSVQAKKQKTAVITDIGDIKEFKKLLRTKTNVLILFVNEPKNSQSITDVFKDTADSMKGQATLAIIDCNNGDGRKLCKKLKISSGKPYYLKHYKDGEFHKDYDRNESVNSLCNFLRDPTGDLPWDEDPTATDIFHLQDGEALNKFLKKGAGAYKKSMIMFYAPWCGYCKTMKPEYVNAAADLKGESLLAAIDVSKPGNSKIRQLYNITGFPTLLYYEKGQYKLPYNGENKRQAMVDFMRDPTTAMQQKKKEVVDESWSQDSDVVHLTAANFDETLSNVRNALVVFYAPWCGHCKRIKPEFEKAARTIKSEKIDGILAAVDATKQPDLASRFGVKGYPTLKYFSKGEYQFDAGHARQEEQIISFIKVCQRAMERSILGVKLTDRVRNTTLRSKTQITDVAQKAAKLKWDWTGHVCRMPNELWAKIATFWSPDTARRRRGRPRRRWRDELDKTNDQWSTLALETGTGSHGERPLPSSGMTQANSISKDPKEPPPPPPPEKPWAEEESPVRHLDSSTFRNTLRKVKHAIIMFYAPWCGHCKSTKPEFVRASENFADELMVIFGAVDCTSNQELCATYDVKGYPTLKYFSYYDKTVKEYTGGRKEGDFVTFILSQGHVQGASQKAVTSQDEGFGINVRMTSDADFLEIIFSATPSFVMFYASWCGHCVQAKPEFSRAADRLVEKNSKVRLYAVDASKNAIVADTANVKGLPTFKLYKRGAVVAEYDGARTADAMFEFINQLPEVKDEL